MIYSGQCHCGALGYAFETSLPPSAWSVRACQCPFCRAHGTQTTSDPQGSLEFRVADPARLVRYRFGLRTADFLICAQCGVYVGSVITAAQGRYGIVNINAMRPIPAGLSQPQPMSYEGENERQRAERREARWTPIVDRF
jgi:hypothetical protein